MTLFLDKGILFKKMKVFRKLPLFLFLVSVLIMSFSRPLFLEDSKVWGMEYYGVIVDGHDTPLPTEGWYYNYTGGDRGVLNEEDISYSWDEDSIYTATVINNPGLWTWGGMWYSLIRIKRDNIPLDFKAIFGPYVRAEYQGEIAEVEIVVSNVSSPSNNTNLELRLELKDKNDITICSKTWADLTSGPYPKIYTWSLDDPCKKSVKLILWIIDKAQLGDSVSIDRIGLKARVSDLATIPTEEQAFLWTYSWLMTNYDPNTGMVQDRSNLGSGDYENVTATAKTAKIAYYAYKKGYTTYNDTEEIITKIADTLINVVPRGPSGINTLWPHFTKNGGTEIVPDTEWASGDTIYAALDIITALQMLDDPQGQIASLENFLQDIDWKALLLEDEPNCHGPGVGISHGYDYNGNLLSSLWKGFGMETIGANWAYASATGNVADMEAPPSDNGSGFIDNAQYPLVFSGLDRWGNNWDTYRNNMADTQIGWYCTPDHYNAYLCNAGLFGLSAAENPEGDSYVAYGVGGKCTGPEDGNGEVIVLHYSGMIADIRPTEAKHMWGVLRDRDAEFLQDRIVISPLNNMESMRVDKETGKCTINHLKGSWNLALQAEGWAQIDCDIKKNLIAAVQNNIFLNRGYGLLKGEVPAPDIKANCSDGPLTIFPGDNLTITVILFPGSHDGEDADWWVAATSPFGLYWYTLDLGWVRSDAPIPVYAGPLFKLSPYDVLNTTDLPIGKYTFYFGVDLLMNGSLDFDQLLYYDSVNVNIE
ncbi:hypothetical protein DRP98_09565 [candidate division KSB1 bacterium]|uniref:Uncharacterized protein n=1 Tax=candidate division WOR-3 bacterium TaxID=2052148 RepID=A0A7V5HNQ0_UNCW3|nr:MAG: hypothetical protein DRP98_09565 [candidate division KSB1 bacterium]HHF53335.1 hypothetical protein [candidate division WOR-3 bacterium]